MQEIGNMEGYVAFMLGKHIVFLHSFLFMSSSLDKLTENLKKCGKCKSCKSDKCLNRTLNSTNSIEQPL